MYAITIPGRTAWLTASPIKDHPRTTKKHDNKEVGMAIIKLTKKAFCINSNWKGKSKFSIIYLFFYKG